MSLAEDSLESPVNSRIAQANAVQNHRLEASRPVGYVADRGDRHEAEADDAPNQDVHAAEAAIELLTRLSKAVHHEFSPRATMALYIILSI